jgi:glycolate oxidase FAD binding subunit
MSTNVDGAVLRPRDATDVAAILAGRERALEVRGGGSKRGIGRVVEADVLELAALRGVVAYEPAELVLTAQAGTPLATIEGLLARTRNGLHEPPVSVGCSAPRPRRRSVACWPQPRGSRRGLGWSTRVTSSASMP